MPGVHRCPAGREALLGLYRVSSDPDIRLRAHILLLLEAGHPWATVSAVLFCSVYDNAGTHTAEGSKLVRAYLTDWGKRVRVHYLPKYAPDTNPIERVWWRLHEAVTRNHRCHTMDELLDLTFDWFATRTHFRVRSEVYTKCPGKCA